MRIAVGSDERTNLTDTVIASLLTIVTSWCSLALWGQRGLGGGSGLAGRQPASR